MTSNQIVQNKQEYNQSVGFLLLSAVLITLFLFFIDEGYYNFNWTSNVGSWMVFFIYTGVIFVAQLLIYKLLHSIPKRSSKVFLSILSGAVIGIFALVRFVF